MAETIRIRNWEKWQSYRRDRGQPPWIKVHRCIMRNPDWVALTDAQRGQLVGMWLLAADHDGVIPASPEMIRKLCFFDETPDLEVFVRHGFIEGGRQGDAKVTPARRQRDQPETETEAEEETDNPPLVPPRGGERKKKAKAKPIPSDWEPSDEHRAKAAKERVDIDREAEKFRNHALANDRRVVRWDAAFSNWILKAKEIQGDSDSLGPRNKEPEYRLLSEMVW